MKNLRFKKTWLIIGLFFLYILFYLCLRPSSGGEPIIKHLDKLLHFSAYFLLSFYFHQIFKEKHSSKIILVLTLTGVGIEFLQELSVNRTFEYLDMVANSSGAIVASLTTMAISKNILIYIESLLERKAS